MAKTTSPKKTLSNIFQDGPHLVSAVLCESVLEEKDGVKTAVRMVDRFTMHFVTQHTESPIPSFKRSLKFLLRLKKGEAGDKHLLKFNLVDPSGHQVGGAFEQTLTFEGGADRGLDLVIDLNLEFERDGIYWINVYLDRFLLTRVPMRVIFIVQRQASDTQETPVS